MIRIAVTQRVETDLPYGERRDALDQRWYDFFFSCGIIPLLLPNHLEAAKEIIANTVVNGILLTGGNTLFAYGGDAPERDQVEEFLIGYALKHNLPLLGVCRGMQVIQHYFGVKLQKITGHITPEQEIMLRGKSVIVNSYHEWGALRTVPELVIEGFAEDGIVKAIRHNRYAVQAIMWHPERFNPFREEDIKYFRHFYGGGGGR